MGVVLPFPTERIVNERLLTRKELALTISYSARWIQYRVNEDAMPHHRLPNGELRFRLSEVQEWLAEREGAA